MEGWVEFAKRAIDATRDGFYWYHFDLPLPRSQESWAVVGLAAVVLVALYYGWMALRPFKGRPLTVKLRDNWTGYQDPEQWNLVQIKLRTAKDEFPLLFGNAVTGEKEPIILKLKAPGENAHSIACRVLFNKNYDEDTLLVHRTLAAKLGLGADFVDGTACEIDFRWSYWRLDKYTYDSPDREIRLQFRIGAIFLLLGILIPKTLDAFPWHS